MKALETQRHDGVSLERNILTASSRKEPRYRLASGAGTGNCLRVCSWEGRNSFAEVVDCKEAREASE
ncbi:hypothetical protein O3P69_016513 [Scylla paramamosain]|uniref:Uncharacterized protein n=1 Tax=Scylla paramamosain TaxID=85552 RepID=A0AAW0TG71_SCYPA